MASETRLPEAAQEQRTVRDAYWDNAKAVLVVLVVIGHSLASVAPHSVSADVLYRWIYAFHMPAFVFVTGILTAELTRRRAGRLVTALLVPYVIFQTVQWLEVGLVEGDLGRLQLLVPRWTLWYLVATVLWRLSAPMWEALQPWAAMSIALAIAVLAGFGSGVGHALALDDALGFLPFFVAGLLLRRAALPQRLGGRRTRAAGVVVLVLAAVVTTALRDRLHRAAFRHVPADDLHATDLKSVVIRIAVLGLAAVCTAALLAALPRGRHWWTSIGEASLYVYLLHVVVLIPWRQGDLPAEVDSAWQVALIALLAVALACVLSRRSVRRATAFAVEPRWAGVLTGRP